MPTATRCKFKLIAKKTEGDMASLTFWPVTTGSKENEEFFKYTPSGQLVLGVVRPNVAEGMVEGAEYYLDITPAAQ